MAQLAGKLLRAVVYTAATVVILLALIVGGLRLLLPLVPGYQQQIRAAAAAATGLTVDFAGISASWPLQGPELQLYDVVLRDPGSGELLLQSTEISLGVGLLRLLRERRISVERIEISGARLQLERDAAGRLLLQGQPLARLAANRAGPAAGSLAGALLLQADDLALSYRDAAVPGPDLDVAFRRLRLQWRKDGLRLQARARLAGASAGELDLAVDFDDRVTPFASADWDFSLTADGVSLAPLLQLLTRVDTPLAGGRGEFVLAGRMRGARPGSLLARLDLRQLALRTGGDEPEILERLAGSIEWEAREGGWLLAASELRLGRGGRLWPRSSLRIEQQQDRDGGRRLAAEADFLRSQDLYLLLRSLATDRARAELLPANVEGDLRDLRVNIRWPRQEPAVYDCRVSFSGLGLRELPGGVTLAGLSGSLAADQHGGRLELAGADTRLALPALFQGPLQLDSLDGLLVWRITPAGVRVLSDDVRLRAATVAASTRFELSRPPGGALQLDLDAAVRAADATQVLPFLPLRKFPPAVSAWLLRAIRAAELRDARVRFRGPLREFPYDHGEGLFRVDLHLLDGRLAFASGWPELRGVDADFVFDGVQFYSRRNTARLGDLRLENVDLRLDDLRRGELAIRVRQPAELGALLAFLRDSPLSDRLGPGLDRLRGSGPLQARLDLELPLRRRAEFGLQGDFELADARLTLAATPLMFTGLSGRLHLDGNRLTAERLEGRLFDAPLSARLQPRAAGGHRLLLSGTTPVEAWIDAFGLPGHGRIDGRAAWQAAALIPAPASGGGLTLAMRSDLVGVRSDLPAPLRKAADERAPLQLALDFGSPDTILVTGSLRDDLAWQLRLAAAGQRWQLERGGVVAGGGRPALPAEPGLVVSGRTSRLVLEDWLALGGDTDGPGLLDKLRRIDAEVQDLDLFGQHFEELRIGLEREADEWRARAKGRRLAGRLRMPLDFSPASPWRLNLQRLWLRAGEEAGDATKRSADPRKLPRMRVHVEDLRLSDMRFGRLDSELTPGPDGVTASPIDIDGGSFRISGDGGWVVLGDDPARQRSRLRAKLTSSDVKDTLERLGYDPVIEGDSATAAADLSWPGAPDADFLARASGRFSIEFGAGALLQLDAGGGRLLGILSITSLPRRLSLDFRDIFDEGLGFDSLKGEFELENGVAFTCNLGLEGSVADMAVVGRVGLAAHDYDQLAVVRPHVSNVLALGGVAVGGPAGGVAALLLSQIFRKPLSQLGESYYEIKGSWEAPRVERVDRSSVDGSRFSDCERYLAEILPSGGEAGDLVSEPGNELPEEIVP